MDVASRPEAKQCCPPTRRSFASLALVPCPVWCQKAGSAVILPKLFFLVCAQCGPHSDICRTDSCEHFGAVWFHMAIMAMILGKWEPPHEAHEDSLGPFQTALMTLTGMRRASSVDAREAENCFVNGTHTHSKMFMRYVSSGDQWSPSCFNLDVYENLT